MGRTEWKRILGRMLAAAVGCLLLIAAVPVSAELNLASEAAILMDAETGQVLYEKNSHKKLYPASITKIMTAILALQNLAPEEVLTVSQSAVSAVPRTSSHISLLPGERLTVEQAMYAIGMESANDAANVLAEAVSGSLTEFGLRMTREAQALGALDTNFTNANGLPDSGHYTTAYDMALITAAALKLPGFSRYFSTVSYVLPATNLSEPRTFANKDRLLPGGQYYYEGVLMAKTGWTTSAQGTFAAAVRRGNTTLIAITLKSPLLEDKYKDTWQLMDYGFLNYTKISLSGKALGGMVDIEGFEPVPDQEFSFLIPAGANRSDLVFTRTDPLPRTETGTVTVSAALDAVTIPSLQLRLQKLQQQPVFPSLAGVVDEILEETLETVEQSPPNWFVVAGGLIALLYAAHVFRRQHARHVRRRHLRARIQRMKKQMH